MQSKRIVCYLLDVASLDADFDGWLSLLPNERREKSTRYLYKKDRLLSLGGGLLIEAFVGKGPYAYNEKGKPSKEGAAFFSLSHSGSLAMLAASEDEVGADIEVLQEKDPNLIDYCFDENERSRIHGPEDFFLRWCEKEALGKLLGFGLKEPKSTPVLPQEDGSVIFEDARCFTRTGFHNGYAYAVAAESPFEIELREVSEGELESLLK